MSAMEFSSTIADSPELGDSKPIGADRYASVNELWQSVAVPPFTRHEAERAARAICRKFGRKTGYPRQRTDAKLREVRRCWITRSPAASVDRGLPRLVHDLSHQIFRKRHPHLRPHNPLHAKLEIEIASYVVNETGWLSGALKAPTKPAPDVRAEKVARVEASLVRWDAKLRRAHNAIAKLKRRRSALMRSKP